MTRSFPDRVTNVGNDLTTMAGSYLRSVTNGPWEACTVCALPVNGYSLCPQCRDHSRSGLPLADRAGFLVYADEPASQTYRVMRGYKEPRTQTTFAPIVEALLAVGLRGHFACANQLARTEDSGWSVIPSAKGRSAFVELVRGLTRTPEAEIEVSFNGTAPDRRINPAAWRLPAGVDFPKHVVVLDDSWVTGASSQSLAVPLKQAGVEQVSILSLARVLSPDWRPNQPFLKDVLPRLPYDWTICPWTLGDCPA
jgi:predicted amidophosphoribosyltransferase